MNIKLEDCQKCRFHKDTKIGQVLCNYQYIISSVTTFSKDKKSDVMVLGCPQEK